MPIKTFKHLRFSPCRHDATGVQAVVMFDNGYGASVIKTKYSYGGPSGLYELAVLRAGPGYPANPDDWSLEYSTPVTNDVLGYLSKRSVTAALKAIQALQAPAYQIEED